MIKEKNNWRIDEYIGVFVVNGHYLCLRTLKTLTSRILKHFKIAITIYIFVLYFYLFRLELNQNTIINYPF